VSPLKPPARRNLRPPVNSHTTGTSPIGMNITARKIPTHLALSASGASEPSPAASATTPEPMKSGVQPTSQGLARQASSGAPGRRPRTANTTTPIPARMRPPGRSSAVSNVPSGHSRAETYGPPDAHVPMPISSYRP
jgi:hypothetical protein